MHRFNWGSEFSFSPLDFSLPGLAIDGDAIPSIDPPVDLDDIQRKVQGAIDAYQNSLARVTNNINVDGSFLQNRLDEFNISIQILDDYNPPDVDALATKRRHHNETSAFRQASAESLQQIFTDVISAHSEDVATTPCLITDVIMTCVLCLTQSTSEVENRGAASNSTLAGLIRAARDTKWFTQVCGVVFT